MFRISGVCRMHAIGTMDADSYAALRGCGVQGRLDADRVWKSFSSAKYAYWFS